MYFLVRHLRPSVVVETGVAAGWVSSAVLTAMDLNGSGHLWSSDLPLLRVGDPDGFVGWLVEPALRHRWTLATRGDRRTLPDTVSRVAEIGLFHYDSDKSYEGRAFAYSQIVPKLTASSLMVWDDIQDNWHFRDITRDDPSAVVLRFEGKFVGVCSSPDAVAALRSQPSTH
jgi:hypothetical protein